MNLADFTTPELVNIISALTDELAARAGSVTAPEPEDPAQTLLASLAGRTKRPPGTPLRRSPIGNSATARVLPAEAAELDPSTLPPGTVIATARTDPASAQAFAARPARPGPNGRAVAPAPAGNGAAADELEVT